MKIVETRSTRRPFKSRPDVGHGALARLRFAGAAFERVKNRSPLAVEIGCGVGLHPLKYAEREPATSIIAIERTREKFEKFERRLRSHPHLEQRICAVHADAIHFLDQSVENETIDEVWILFPNPESSKTTRRWFQTPFMSRLVQLMKPGAKLFFATNLEDYASTASKFAADYGLKEIKFEKITRESRPSFEPRTHFEKKYFDRGETIFNFEFRLDSAEA